MQTIKERADRAIYKPTDRHPVKLCEAIAFAKGYELGATEQKAIDEELRLKKCDDMTEAEYVREVAFADWYHKNGKGTPTFSDAIEWARRKLIDKACEWLKENIDGGVHPSNTYGFVEKFKKAMEEDNGQD